MRILSLVTLFSPQAEYGGPMRVALNQAQALRQDGHDVLVAGSARGYTGPLPDRISGVPVVLYPAHTIVYGTGFAGLSSIGLYAWIRRYAYMADIIHVHLARDLVTMPAANWIRRKRLPYVVQTHGMIDPSSRILAPLLDSLMTRRVLQGAKAVLHLTSHERSMLIAVGGHSLAFRKLVNGVPLPSVTRDPGAKREVLFLARLALRKRPMAFVEMSRRLAAKHPEVAFRLVGPDEGQGNRVREAISTGPGQADVRWEGAVSADESATRMVHASIYVLPSVDEPYPMSVLEAMSLGIPVVITESCGLADVVRRSGAGLIVDGSIESLVEAVGTMLSNPADTRRMGMAGERITGEEFSMQTIKEQLLEAYRVM